MTDLVRTVRSGSVGLDLVLGGGLRLLRRIADSASESASMLVRGGPGVGKSVFAADSALHVAGALGCDVLYVCIEILPREVIAQRLGFDGVNPAKAVDLADAEARKTGSEGPTLVVGMTELAAGEGGVPDVGGMILELVRIAVDRGFDPRVVVVDSLSDGYGLGAGVPRPTVDGVCKLAVEQGWVLLLVEEAADARASTWAFAMDTVLTLSVTPAGRREVMVTKHRFGSCQPGPHRLLVEREGVRVLPCFAAYRNAVRDLDLPAPATKRSLRVPVVGEAPDWKSFDVSDGQGRVLIIGGGPADAVEWVTASAGATAQDGSEHGGARVTLWLHETAYRPFFKDVTGFNFGTLHQSIDGEEWLESALRRIAEHDSPLARIRIGPTAHLQIYEHGETIRWAISLLATILERRGHVVVVFGADCASAIRAGIVAEQWTVMKQPQGQVQVVRSAGNTGPADVFVVPTA